MKRLLLVILLNFILAGFAQAAVEVGGVRFEDKSRVADSELQLNGAGVPRVPSVCNCNCCVI